VEALRAALGSTTREWALLTGVDMPGLDSGALGALLRARADGVDVVCFADSSGRRHPLPGCYRRSLLDSGRLEAGGAFQALLDAVPLRTLSPPTPVSIANVNRPTDFVQFWNGPPTPNWVCSDASEPARRVEPLSGRSVEETWTAAELWLRRRGDVTIVLSTPDYIAAEFRIPVFGYVDDLELNRRGDSIAVRSASRVGIWDMGVNRRRVEAMRRELRSLGVVA
jgi:uncharacterized protein (DUF1499 family)